MHKNSKSGFTVIELLAVIGILILIASMLFVGLERARSRARRTRAAREVDQIMTAWESYYFDYRRFPDDSININQDGMQEPAIKILRGENYQGQNSLETEYMDFSEYVTQFNDPWGNAYMLALDEVPYDGRVSVPHEADLLPRSVAVWSVGEDGIEDTKDDVTSWVSR